ncbi:MAG: outer membrane autotransporter protein, partial [Gammaproteobacteria bacterium]
VKTRFNNGEQSATGISVTPYIGYLFSNWLTFDAAVGIGSVSTDQFRTAGAARISSDVESTRIYGSMNATATWTFDRVLASGRAGLLYATQEDDKFLESNGAAVARSRSSVGRLLFGGELAYSLAAWEPYVSGTFEHDFTRTRTIAVAGVAQPKNDDTDVLFATGLRYFGKNNISGSVEYSTVLGRRNLDEDNFSASVRWQF